MCTKQKTQSRGLSFISFPALRILYLPTYECTYRVYLWYSSSSSTTTTTYHWRISHLYSAAGLHFSRPTGIIV